ncbi:hypothetical protein PVAND_008286 [Polypedilum vanderplanki]|uniref:Arf-GAP domain-containing protein n=1 Tax=Polypedilum vanderplanki TaxID=319348 RepID=A0A9J6CAJ6_POLVA|nr:hypothetical protein PVAND_008286 [Polypedilum vanderplanki]
MSRGKNRGLEVCGDCNSQDPPFASLNKGILLCSDCASVHRQLGTHLSIVKPLRHGQWNQSLLSFVHQINSHNANSVWEHLLLDPNSKLQKKKPTPKDSIQTKSQFIRSKHVNLEFVLKPNLNETSTNIEVELSKQLHASVRSANLETSLRLIAQGANCNYIHKDKNCTTPIHVAAKAGQSAQCELLLIYGADINAVDGSGNNAIDLARQNQFTQLADRLVEASYEVTDRIIYFLCGRKPDHTSGQHLIIPEQTKVEINEHLKIARGKLQLIPNKMFEELVMDLYEEVDRRETETIWSTICSNPEIGAVPFLVTNPHLSATRNQGRQKLARFSHAEFCGLLSDILVDASRRKNIANLRPLEQMRGNRESTNSDDEPLYDAVCEDDDYGHASLPSMSQQNATNNSLPSTSTGTIVSSQTNVATAADNNSELEQLRKQLKNSELTITELKAIVEKLSLENSILKTRIDSSPISQEVQLRIHDTPENSPTEPEPSKPLNVNSKRPVSMYEARQAPRDENRPPVTQSLYSVASNSSGSSSTTSLPIVDEVTKRTEIVTRRIQELWLAMQDLSSKDKFIPCSERIRLGVTDLIAIFPKTATDEHEILRSALRNLNVNTTAIQNECANLQRALNSENPTNIDVHLQQVRNCAYNLAKATKTLVTQFQQ